MRRVLGVLVFGSMLGVVFAGCGGGSEGEGSAPGSSPAPPPSSTVESTSPATQLRSDEEAILAAYQGYWDTWLAANDPPNPDHPDLARYYTGEALQRAVSSINENARLGRVLRLPQPSVFRFTASGIRATGSSAEFLACVVDDGWVIDASSGEVLNSQVMTSRIRVSLLKEADGWRVVRHDYLDSVAGQQRCADR